MDYDKRKKIPKAIKKGQSTETGNIGYKRRYVVETTICKQTQISKIRYKFKKTETTALILQSTLLKINNEIGRKPEFSAIYKSNHLYL